MKFLGLQMYIYMQLLTIFLVVIIISYPVLQVYGPFAKPYKPSIKKLDRSNPIADKELANSPGWKKIIEAVKDRAKPYKPIEEPQSKMDPKSQEIATKYIYEFSLLSLNSLKSFRDVVSTVSYLLINFIVWK
ncbi:MAG: hypothetical protein P0116_16420 [Candidatus Nitrosocosmicus sp.]|nr:hypothetical protein [Candidatus Nitrosocosmicus sp.]